jgi:hypothetical protein
VTFKRIGHGLLILLVALTLMAEVASWASTRWDNRWLADQEGTFRRWDAPSQIRWGFPDNQNSFRALPKTMANEFQTGAEIPWHRIYEVLHET